MNNVLIEFKNVALNYAALVVKNFKGFGVNIYDYDGANFVGAIKVFSNYDDAIEYAAKCAAD